MRLASDSSDDVGVWVVLGWKVTIGEVPPKRRSGWSRAQSQSAVGTQRVDRSGRDACSDREGLPGFRSHVSAGFSWHAPELGGSS